MARLLVIDDSQMAQLLARVTFEEEGHEVVEAMDGESGLEAARNHKPDCIFLDLLMPGMQGHDVLRVLQQELPEVPVIVLTADVHESTRDECLALGALAVVDKPRSGEDLLAAVRLVFPRP